MIWTTRPQRGPLPLVIGVTGHRDIRRGDVGQLRRQVDAIFQDLEHRLPHTPLIVLSALAEGADRLVARVGLRRGATLIVPLPMPAEQFTTDFADERSLREFRWLCDRADAVYVVPFRDPEDRADAAPAGLKRDRRYAASSAYVAVNSEVLIALWDGENSGSLGGTASTVNYKLGGVPEPFGVRSGAFDAADSGLVFHVVTPRQGRAPPAKPFMRQTLVPSGWGDARDARKSYDKIFRRIETFNADSCKLRSVLRQDAAQVPAMRLFVIADELAIRYQRTSRRAIHAIFWIVVLAGIAFELFAHLLHRTSYLAFAIFGVMAATLIFNFARRAGFEVKSQEYRALAEGLRVQQHWHAADVTDSAADYYLRRQKSELDWIRDAMRSSRVLADAQASKDTDREPLRVRLNMTWQCWIANQREYFSRSRVSQDRKARSFTRVASTMFLGGFVLAIFVLGWLVSNHASIEDQRWGELFVTIVALTLVVSDHLRSYSEKREWSAHAKQHGRLSLIFAHAATRMRQLLDDPSEAGLISAQHLLRELGRETLTETGDWLLMHREESLDEIVG